MNPSIGYGGRKNKNEAAITHVAHNLVYEKKRKYKNFKGDQSIQSSNC